MGDEQGYECVSRETRGVGRVLGAENGRAMERWAWRNCGDEHMGKLGWIGDGGGWQKQHKCVIRDGSGSRGAGEFMSY